MLAYRDGATVRLISRNGVDHTRRFRALAAAIAKLPEQTLVLDGEVAVYDEKLASRFHLPGDDESGILCMPPLFIAFDALQVGLHDLPPPPLHERRAILEEQLDDADMVLPCRRLPDDPVMAWAIVEERGHERMVAKDLRWRACGRVRPRSPGVPRCGGVGYRADVLAVMRCAEDHPFRT